MAIDEEREAIIRELLAGKQPYMLNQYNYKKVYDCFRDLRDSGQLQPNTPSQTPEQKFADISAKSQAIKPPNNVTPAPPPLFVPVDDPGEPPEVINPEPKIKVRGQGNKTTKTTAYRDAAEKVESAAIFEGTQTGHAVSYNQAAVNRIRGILGIQAKPKVLAMPMPELLYPAMVIATTELGWPPMTPENFIDTVIYQWLEACDYVPYMYIKKSEAAELVKTGGRDMMSDAELIAELKKRNINPYVQTQVPVGAGVTGGNGHNHNHDGGGDNDSSGRTESNSTEDQLDGQGGQSSPQDEGGGNHGAAGGNGSPEILGGGAGEDGSPI